MHYNNTNTMIYQDGRFIKVATAQVDLFSQTLHYGFGAFEGMRAYKTHNDTRIFKALSHFTRLEESCKLACLPFNWDKHELIKHTYRLLELNKLKDAYIRPLVFSKPNMGLQAAQEVSIAIVAWEWGAFLGDKQLRTCISPFERISPKATLIDAKLTGNYVNSILATTEAKNKGFDEAILLDSRGFVAESASANIFIEKNGVLYTPAKGHILPGITRKAVIDLCQVLDIEIIEKQISVDELKAADGAFFCGTAVEIAPIASIDDTVFRERWADTIGATIQRAYKNLVLEKVNYEVII